MELLAVWRHNKPKNVLSPSLKGPYNFHCYTLGTGTPYFIGKRWVWKGGFICTIR